MPCKPGTEPAMLLPFDTQSAAIPCTIRMLHTCVVCRLYAGLTSRQNMPGSCAGMLRAPGKQPLAVARRLHPVHRLYCQRTKVFQTSRLLLLNDCG